MVESMRCRNCGAAFDADRIDRSLGIVVCEHCGGLHELPRPSGGPSSAERSEQVTSSVPAHVDPRRGTVPLPDRFDVHRGAGSLRVRWLFFLAHVALPILYYAAVRGINRSELRASAGEVEIRTGPLPWRGARRLLKRADIQQLFAREVVTRRRVDSNDGRKVQREYRSYAVEALDRAGKRRRLIGGLSTPEQALWFERELEGLFGIENVRIAGELR